MITHQQHHQMLQLHQNDMITLKMSRLPSKCNDYPQNVMITLKVSRLP